MSSGNRNSSGCLYNVFADRPFELDDEMCVEREKAVHVERDRGQPKERRKEERIVTLRHYTTSTVKVYPL